MNIARPITPSESQNIPTATAAVGWGPHCTPNIAVNIVNRIFTFFDEDRSPDNSDGISIEPPIQAAMDSAIALRPELTPKRIADVSE